MKRDNKPPPIPDGLDLGNVTSAPVGAEIAVLGTYKTGKPTVAASLYVVHKDDGWRLLLHNMEGKSAGAIVKERNGASPYFMVNKWFYYSANPAHIKLAKTKIKAAKRREEKRKAAHEAKMAIARPIGELLGDGEAYDTYGEPYQSSLIARGLSERLTIEQLQILSEWIIES